jgi:RNA polymerase sigma-70 factor (ECF subfamily)
MFPRRAATVRAVAENDELRALIAEAQDGNVRAFELLVASRMSQIRRYARAFATSDADADDLAQEALVKVYKSLRSFRFQASFTTWLYSLVRNVFLDAVRSRAGRERSVEEPLTEDHARTPSSAESADEHLLRTEERQKVWRALRQLPPEFRTALVLFDVEGHSYEEVAAIEGVPMGTVKSRLSRGRGLLRDILAGEQPEAPSLAPGEAGTSGTHPPSHVRRSGK